VRGNGSTTGAVRTRRCLLDDVDAEDDKEEEIS
jgi:hypothetical protein